MKKISSLIFTNYKVLISRISKSNYLSFSKTVNKQPFFFLLRTISYQIISNYKEHKRDQNFYSSKNTFESVLLSLLHLFSLFSSRPKSPRCHEFHAGHSVYGDRKREREWIEFIHGRGRVILCVARGLCVEKILTAFFHALRGPKKGEKDEAISTRRKSPSVSLQGRPGL